MVDKTDKTIDKTDKTVELTDKMIEKIDCKVDKDWILLLWYLYWFITSLVQLRLISETSVGIVVIFPAVGLRDISDIFLREKN